MKRIISSLKCFADWRKTAFVALFSLASTLMADQVNLLESGSESWTQGWKAGYGCSLSLAPVGSEMVLRQTLPDDFSKGNHSWQMRVPVTPGDAYSFHVLYQLQDVDSAMVQFHFADQKGKLMDYLKFRLSTEVLKGSTQDWKTLNYNFEAPEGAAYVLVALRLNSPGTVYWDKPTLQVVDKSN